MPNDLTFLDGAELRGALLAACEQVQRARAELNRINVFPVPDGDTGTNFALTARSIADRLRGNHDASVGQVAAAAAEAAILGARGNCGMILSHFLLGFSEAVGHRERLDVGEFTATLGAAVDHVYRALEHPVEGTIVTVMRDTARAAELSPAEDFPTLFEQMLVRAREALARTPELLPALRVAGVVDAGALGFVHLLEGMAAYLSDDPSLALEAVPVAGGAGEDAPMAAAQAEFPGANERFRFCTEALVRGDALPDAEMVRAVLREQGDSLVVIRSGNLLKVHMHTDQPEALFAYLRGVGTLVTHKAEDMQVQHAALGGAHAHRQLARRPVVLLSDSACDLPEEVVRAHGIEIVPLNLLFDDEVLRDRVDISSREFTERLLQGAHPTTSQPTPAAFLTGFRHCAEEGEQVVAVLLSSALSGTFASAEAAARRLEATPLTLIDSRAASLLQGLQVLRAAELAEEGRTPSEIVAELARIREQSGIFFTVDTFDRLLASGRVGRGRAWLGTLLDIKPILEIDSSGKVIPTDRARGRPNVLPRVMEILEKRVPRGRDVRFGIVHVACEEVLSEVAEALYARYGRDLEILTAPASPVLATHIGPGAWGLAYQVED